MISKAVHYKNSSTQYLLWLVSWFQEQTPFSQPWKFYQFPHESGINGIYLICLLQARLWSRFQGEILKGGGWQSLYLKLSEAKSCKRTWSSRWSSREILIVCQSSHPLRAWWLWCLALFLSYHPWTRKVFLYKGTR